LEGYAGDAAAQRLARDFDGKRPFLRSGHGEQSDLAVGGCYTHGLYCGSKAAWARRGRGHPARIDGERRPAGEDAYRGPLAAADNAELPPAPDVRRLRRGVRWHELTNISRADIDHSVFRFRHTR
jgi:hypothetical protein